MTYTPDVLFPLGQVVSTPAALAAVSADYLGACLARHVTGDFGVTPELDADLNRAAMTTGTGSIQSAFPIDDAEPCEGFGDNTIWIITQPDIGVTTILLPNEN